MKSERGSRGGQVMKLEINRAEWLRGTAPRPSHLLQANGKRCCVGILGRALGIPDATMLDRQTARHAPAEEWPVWLNEPGPWGRSQASLLYGSNDDSDDVDREPRIAAIFARCGVEVTFVDGPEPKAVA